MSTKQQPAETRGAIAGSAAPRAEPRRPVASIDRRETEKTLVDLSAEPRDASAPGTVTWDLSTLAGEPWWRGAVDVCDGNVVVGWTVSVRNILKPVCLEIWLDDVLLGTTTTGLWREDIAKVVRLPVSAGFEFDIAGCRGDAAEKLLQRLRSGTETERSIASRLRVVVQGADARIPLSPAIAGAPLDGARLERSLAEAWRSPALLDAREAGNRQVRLRDSLLAPPVADEAAARDVRVIAYYLPQFHAIPENDDWWGPGFTEWTNVVSAKPFFADHHQPRLPADLGFYDLGLETVQEKQIALAKQYGVSGFCYYYYWFSGATLLTLPIERHLEKDYDFDFCLCWANESWSRRWDGSEADVLMKQTHSFDSDVEFIRSCLRFFRSPRYVKIDGAPVIQIYRASLMAKPAETIELWREIVMAEGFPGLHVTMVESFGLSDPHAHGCDSSVQFPPHGVTSRERNGDIADLDPAFDGKIYDYAEVVGNELAAPRPSHLRFRTAMPSWDNSSRKGRSGAVFDGASPALFETWMTHLVEDARDRLPAGMRFVFVNAWNEWAEGAHLEPDRRHGHANLRAVRSALTSPRAALAALSPPSDPEADDPFADARRFVGGLLRANAALATLLAPRYGLRGGHEVGFAAAPRRLLSVRDAPEGFAQIDSLNGRLCPGGCVAPLSVEQGLGLRGWVRAPGIALRPSTPLFVSLRDAVDAEERRFIASVHEREAREEVVRALSLDDGALHCGFSFSARLAGVPPGRYRLEILVADPAAVAEAIAHPTTVHLIVG